MTLTPDVDFDLDFVNAQIRDGTASFKGEGDLSGELFRSTLALSLERGGVLLRTYLSAHTTFNVRKTSS